MKSVAISLMCCVTALACAWLLTQQPRTSELRSAIAQPPPTSVREPDYYEFHATESQIFLVNQQSGYVWRYFRNNDEKGKPTAEGFIQLGFVPLPDKKEWGADDQAVPPAQKPFNPDEFLKAKPSATLRPK